MTRTIPHPFTRSPAKGETVIKKMPAPMERGREVFMRISYEIVDELLSELPIMVCKLKTMADFCIHHDDEEVWDIEGLGWILSDISSGLDRLTKALDEDEGEETSENQS